MSKRHSFDVSSAESLADRLPDVGRGAAFPIGIGNPALLDPSSAVREQASQIGFAAGYEAGFRQGIEDAREKEAESLESFRRELAALVDRIEKSMSLWYEKAEHGLAELSLEIARRIIGDAVSMDPAAVLHVVRNAMARVEMANKAVIRVNALDLPMLEEKYAEVVASARSVNEVQFVGDDSLSRGSVIIETEEGVVDASVESQALRLFRGEAA